MATIYAAPEHIKAPQYDWSKVSDWAEKNEKYIQELKEFCEENNTGGKNVGEVVRFPHADSTADYMVASMRPLELIHLETGDAWHYPYIQNMKAKDIQEKINQQKSLRKLFS